MSEERRRILNMLAEGKITAEQAENLMEAMGHGEPMSAEMPEVKSSPRPEPKFLRVQINARDHHTGKPEQVNIKVPFKLIKAGIKLGSLMPERARNKVNDALGEKGIHLDLANLNEESLKDVIEALSELKIDVNEGGEQVRIFVE